MNPNVLAGESIPLIKSPVPKVNHDMNDKVTSAVCGPRFQLDALE
jgi:hypothetical protein